jgi:hypothetical protein
MLVIRAFPVIASMGLITTSSGIIGSSNATVVMASSNRLH